MSEYRVTWIIDVEADSAVDAALVARAAHQDRHSLATMYNVVPWCSACQMHHPEDATNLDLMENTSVQ